MLTGWEVGYWTTDQHVKDVGIWIDNWSYSVGPTGGTLHYRLSSTLRDEDGTPYNYEHHKITILGIRSLSPAVRQSP